MALQEVELSPKQLEKSYEASVLEDLATKLSDDYRKFMPVDSTFEKHSLAEAIEDNLAHLEEFCGLLDLIRDTNTECFEVLLPKIREEGVYLENLYADIDKLEHAVGLVKRTVLNMEEEVNKAEKLLGNSNSVKKFFNSLFNGSKKILTHRRPKYFEPELFKTSELYAPPSSTTSEQPSSNAELEPK